MDFRKVAAEIEEGKTFAAGLVRARVVQDDCAECRNALLAESKSRGGLPLGGDIVIVPERWVEAKCPHGHPGLKFEPVADAVDVRTQEVGRAKPDGAELESTYLGIDATKDFGYPAREHGPYGSPPAYDDYDDESGPDGSGTY